MPRQTKIHLISSRLYMYNIVNYLSAYVVLYGSNIQANTFYRCRWVVIYYVNHDKNVVFYHTSFVNVWACVCVLVWTLCQFPMTTIYGFKIYAYAHIDMKYVILIWNRGWCYCIFDFPKLTVLPVGVHFFSEWCTV